MNLFRSEEHARRWSLYHRADDDYIMPVSDWGKVFTASLFKNRLDKDYLSHVDAYLRDYRQALKAMARQSRHLTEFCQPCYSRTSWAQRT